MKQVEKRESMVYWMGVARAVLLIFFMVVWLGACNVGMDQKPEPKPDPEPEDTNNLTVQPVVVTNTERHELVNESRQCVAPLNDGGFAMVWTAAGYPYQDIMMQWVDSQGNHRLENGGLQINSVDGDIENIVVIARPAGGVYVAFLQDDGMGYRVKVQAFNETMTALWPEPVTVSVYENGWEAQREATLAPAPSGGVYVSYYSYNLNEKYQVKCQRLNAEGNRMWGEKGKSLCSNYTFTTDPKVVLDKSGGLYVFWKNLRDAFAQELDPILIEGQHLTPSGVKTWGNEPKIIRTTNSLACNYYIHSDFMVAPDGYGGAIVSWIEDFDITDQQLDVLAQRVNIDGALLWNNGVILSDPNQFSQLDASIAANDGGVFISFFEYINESTNRLWIQRLGANGEKLWGSYGVDLSNPKGLNCSFSVYGYFTGKYLNICWTYQLAPYTNDFKVMMGRFKADGTFMDPPGGVVLDNTGTPQISRGMVYNEASKEYFVLWEDQRNIALRHDSDILGAILKKTASSTSRQLSYQGASLSTSKRSYLPEPFRMNNNGLYLQQPFNLPGQKVVRRGDK